MRKPLVLVAVLALAALAVGQTTPPAIDSSAVWQPGSDFLANAHTACDKVTPAGKFSDCVINQMSKAGAPAAAVSFSRELHKQTAGEVGIMEGFHKVGPIDIAWVQYPLRNTYGLLLVNGSPRIINAEDLKQLDQKSMQQSFQFQSLQESIPQRWIVARRSRRQDLAEFADRQQGRLAVHHRLSATQWLSDLRARRLCSLSMELQSQWKVHGHQLPGHDARAAVATRAERPTAVDFARAANRGRLFLVAGKQTGVACALALVIALGALQRFQVGRHQGLQAQRTHALRHFEGVLAAQKMTHGLFGLHHPA